MWGLPYALRAVAAWPFFWRRGGWRFQRQLLEFVLSVVSERPGGPPSCLACIARGLAAAVWARAGDDRGHFWRGGPLRYWAWVTFAAALNFTIWRPNS